jgi:stage II sporulation protein B
MSAKRPIVVRIDGKQAREQLSGKRNGEKIEHTGLEEVAAAEESSENRIHTFAREYDTTLMLAKTTSKKQSKFEMFKPIIIAIFSAAIIGSIMGFVMLKIIVNFDNDLNGTPAIALPSGGKEQEDQGEGNNSTTTSLYTIEPMSAFVLQGGVFLSSANAEAESKKFIEQGYSPIIWERDSQFFLLVNLGMSKADLQQDINALSENGIEVYAKEWQIGEREIELSESDYQWVTSFQENWNMALGKGSLEIESWQSLLDKAPKSESFNGFVTALDEQVNSINEKDFGQVLLAMWQSFDSFISTE